MTRCNTALVLEAAERYLDAAKAFALPLVLFNSFPADFPAWLDLTLLFLQSVGDTDFATHILLILE